ncbi:MAG: phosphatidate cytidylyltransferase [Gammaproteobacteria bacterium]|nr:phosphatidate cytidylyltransferase [Gammaproteobacteria bacterium]
MFKQRLLTAVVLLPGVIALVLYAPSMLLALVFSAVVLLGAYEWALLAGYLQRGARLRYCGVTLLLCTLLYIAGWRGSWTLLLTAMMVVALGWWLLVPGWLVWRITFPRSLKAVCGWLTLIPALFAVVALQAFRPGVLLWLLALVWAADIGAYIAGHAFGRHKLAPLVSPGKTWEGVIGGTLALLVAAYAGMWLVLPQAGPRLILICMLTGWLSILGDLSESLFKRQANRKDSGTLFPGHGGVLDRIDSLTAAAPVFWLGLSLMGWLR